MHHHARITRKGHDIAYVQIPLGGPDHIVEVPGLRQVRGLYVVRSGRIRVVELGIFGVSL